MRVPAGRARKAGACGLLALSLLVMAVGCADDPRSVSPTPSTRTPSSPIPEPSTSPAPSLHERALDIVSTLSVHEQASLISMGTAPGTDPVELNRFLTSTDIGGFIFMGDNVPAAPEQLAELTAAIQPDRELPMLLAIDQEGGDVSRLPWDNHASALTLKAEAPEATAEAFTSRAQLLEAGGIAVNFGIVADYTPVDTDFMFSRVLGTTAEAASARVAAAVSAESGRVLSTLKHFPGHGAAAGDSHVSIPVSSMGFAEWETGPALPFVAGIEAGAELLMFGHLAYPEIDAVPASVSPEWHRIAREELGFDGVAVTDDLGMLLSSGVPDYADPVENAVQALKSGNDLLVWIAGADETSLTAMVDGVAAAVDAGEVPTERLREAAIRVTILKLEVAGYSDDG